MEKVMEEKKKLIEQLADIIYEKSYNESFIETVLNDLYKIAFDKGYELGMVDGYNECNEEI
jgi:hypothetical protein